MLRSLVGSEMCIRDRVRIHFLPLCLRCHRLRIGPQTAIDFGFDRGQFEIFVIVQILRNLPFNFRRFRGSVDDDGFVLPVLRSAGAVHLRVTDGKGSKNASQPSMASDLASAFCLGAVFAWIQCCFQVQHRPLIRIAPSNDFGAMRFFVDLRQAASR